VTNSYTDMVRHPTPTHIDQVALKPPSRLRTQLLAYSLSTRKSAASATSWTEPKRLRGMAARARDRASGVMAGRASARAGGGQRGPTIGHGTVDVAGQDGIDADIQGAQLGGKRPRQAWTSVSERGDGGGAGSGGRT
jgi:hypothetical protein